MTDAGMIRPSSWRTLSSPMARLRIAAGSRFGLLITAAVAVVAGLGFNWSWLAAAGVAPLIVAALPCAAMCALGLCMMQMGRKGAAPEPSNDMAQGAGSDKTRGGRS
jgi:hypothetical protein